MASVRPLRSSPPPLPDFEGPVDHALTLLLADETEAALRWGAAALERTPHAPGAVVVTSRLLERMGRMRAAIDGLRFATRQAIEREDLPLAIVAIEDLKTLGVDVSTEVEEVASAFCRESPRLEPAPSAMRDLEFGDFQPLSPFLAGPALASKAAQILQSSKRTHEDAAQGDKPALSALPLFSALSKPALHDLLAAFKIMTVPSGHRVIEEGAVLDEAYVVAQGELEISRQQQEDRSQGVSFRAQDVAAAKAKPPIVLTRLGRGAFFGEMAAVSKLAAPSTVTATRPSILLVAKRAALEAIAAKYPDAGVELAAHCRRHMVANLGWTSPVIASMPARERTALVERLEMRFFDRGEKLVQQGEDATGLYLIISGAVAVVGRDGRERVALASLGAGETVGEVELVLCRKANAEAVALRPTAALFLSREDFFALVEEHPAVLYGLYGIAVRRYNETQLALQAGSEHIAESLMLELDEAYGRGPTAKRRSMPAVSVAPVVEATPMASAVDTPAGPPVAIAPTIFVREAEPATPWSERVEFPTLLPPSVRPSQTPRSPRVAASTTTTTRPSPGHASVPQADTRSIAPTTSSLPPGRPTPRRAPSSARQAVRAVGLAAVAAGVVAAALVASRDTQTVGGLGSAAAAAGREPAVAPTTDTASGGGAPSQGAPAAPPAPVAPAPQKTTRTSTAAATPKWGALNAMAKAPVRPTVTSAPAQNSPRASEVANVRSVPAPASSMASAPVAPASSLATSTAVATPPVTTTTPTIAAAPSVAPPPSPAVAAPVPEPKAPNAGTKAIDDEFGGRQ